MIYHFNELYNNNIVIKEIYLMVRALCYINPEYVLFCLEKLKALHNAPEIKDFIEYYKKTYAYDEASMLSSNYFDRNKLRTNNIAEGNNNKLYNLFNKKPKSIRLLFELRYEEAYYKSLFEKINGGEYIGHKKRKKSFDRQLYIDKAHKAVKDILLLNDENGCENKIVDIWFNCLKDLSMFEYDILFG